MSEALQVQGMVLSTMPMGETDKRVVLLTRELGKISAFARGARRPGSSLLGVTDPFSFGSFSLFQGRNAYSLVQASVDRQFRELAEDPVAVYYGYYFLDFAAYYGREGLEARDMLNLLYLSLRALLHEGLENRLVQRIFELRIMSLNGEFAPPAEGLSEGGLYAVQYSIRAPLERLFQFRVRKDILEEIGTMLDRYMKGTLDRSLKSRTILEAVIAEEEKR